MTRWSQTRKIPTCYKNRGRPERIGGSSTGILLLTVKSQAKSGSKTPLFLLPQEGKNPLTALLLGALILVFSFSLCYNKCKRIKKP